MTAILVDARDTPNGLGIMQYEDKSSGEPFIGIYATCGCVDFETREKKDFDVVSYKEITYKIRRCAEHYIDYTTTTVYGSNFINRFLATDEDEVMRDFPEWLSDMLRVDINDIKIKWIGND